MRVPLVEDKELLGEDHRSPDQFGYAALLLGIVLLLHFISASFIADNRGFKAFVGWMTLIAGAALVFFGFAEALGVDFGTL